MFSFKTQRKMFAAKVKQFFFKKRFIGSYQNKKRILVVFLFLVNAYIMFDVSVKMPQVEIRLSDGPLVIENRVQAKIDASPAIVEQSFEDKMSELIWTRESSKGINNYSKCKAIGKVNEIGYSIPGDGSYICFDNHEDEMVTLKGWIIAKKAAGWSEKQMLCTYSGGNYKECK